jgi:hypothetical protein
MIMYNRKGGVLELEAKAVEVEIECAGVKVEE